MFAGGKKIRPTFTQLIQEGLVGTRSRREFGSSVKLLKNYGSGTTNVTTRLATGRWAGLLN